MGLRISSQVRRFFFVLKTGAFQKNLGAFLPTKKRLRKQKTGSEENLSRFFCFWTRLKERLLFEIYAVSLAFGHKKAPLNCIKIEVQICLRILILIQIKPENPAILRGFLFFGWKSRDLLSPRKAKIESLIANDKQRYRLISEDCFQTLFVHKLSYRLRGTRFWAIVWYLKISLEN